MNIAKAMEFNVIPFADVERSIQKARDNWQETKDYNTHAHNRGEMSSFIRKSGIEDWHFEYKPDQWPARHSNWLRVIGESQGITDCHIFELSEHFATEISSAFAVWAVRGQIRSETFAEALQLMPKYTTSGVPISRIFDGQEWFLRLEYASTKDSEHKSAPIRSEADMMWRLCTSARAKWALLDDLEEPKQPLMDDMTKGMRRKARIFLLPFNKAMDPAREFRVFCAPPFGKITAISQYKWTSPFFTSDPEEIRECARLVYEGAMEMHDRLMQHAGTLDERDGSSIPDMMKEQGFTFDILLDRAGKIRLVEVNSFGAMGPCGSCLFHWIKDISLLYGFEEMVQVRIAL